MLRSFCTFQTNQEPCMQTTSQIMMIEPANFHSNPATLADNRFQKASAHSIQDDALKEFTDLRKAIEASGIKVLLFRDAVQNNTPDSIFPNNWVSTHEDGKMVLYPMKAENRRRERRKDIIETLRNDYPDLLDLSDYENKGKFLEGTGSLVLDRVNDIAYASLSQRTSMDLLAEWASHFNYRVVTFSALCLKGDPVYHTNVVMSIGSSFIIVCTDSIKKRNERQTVMRSLSESGREIIEISQFQVESFCGNILQLENSSGDSVIVMSTQAYNGFTDNQRYLLKQHGKLLHCPIDTIETYGGGSVRCMICELF